MQRYQPQYFSLSLAAILKISNYLTIKYLNIINSKKIMESFMLSKI